MLKMISRAVAVVALMLATVVMTGCEEKVSQENFDKIKVGGTLAEAEAFMGKGEYETVMSGGISAGGISSTEVKTSNTYKWEHGTKAITVTVVDGKILQKNKTW